MKRKFTAIALFMTIGFGLSMGVTTAPEVSVLDMDLTPSKVRDLPSINGDAAGSMVTEKMRHTKTHNLPTGPVETVSKTNERCIMRAAGNGEKTEKLDSVVRVDLNGNLISTQTFEYSETGVPLKCLSFVPGEDNTMELKNYMSYTYDNLGRLISREVVYTGYTGGNTKYEYIYEGENNNYSTLLFYYGQDENGEWFPSEIADVVYDSNGNMISVSKGYWDGEKWQYYQKQTATWDELNRQTSFFVYEWNYMTNDWVGKTDTLDYGKEYVYNEDDSDKEIHYYAWENGAWLQYGLEEFTYDANGNILTDDVKYWNREAGDWSGNDRYGQFGVRLTNYRLDYVYDELGREVGLNVYDTDSDGEYYNSAYFVWTYTPLENGNIEKIERYYNMWDGTGVPVIQWEKLYELNPFGSEAHYLNYTYAHAEKPGEKVAIDEEVRFMDEYNNYFGADFYGFNVDATNSRYGAAKERYEFADDFDYSSGLNTPVRGYHWNGTSYDTDTEWSPVSSYYYEWTHGKYLVSRQAFSIIDYEEYPLYGYLYERVYDVPYSQLVMWAFTNRSNEAFYEYKTIAETTLKGGVDDWDRVKSYTDYFYYSPFYYGTDEVNEVVEPKGTVVAYFDITGRRLNELGNGVNIVVYSDGTSKKVIGK